MCSEAQALGRAWITPSRSSGKSFGCGDVKRKRISGCATASCSSRPAKRMLAFGGGTIGRKPSRIGGGAASSPLSTLPSAYELTFWPSSVTSRKPSAASCATSSAIEATGRERSRPRVCGTMQ